MDLLTSRFFTIRDERSDHFVLPLPSAWWSRPYEYSWASQFTEESDTVLDAACGIEHPYKFYLLDTCREVYACDLDERVLSRSAMFHELRQIYGQEATDKLPEKYFSRIHYSRASLTELPYADRMFDKIFCISVLEHLKDLFNKHNITFGFTILRLFLRNDLYVALREFRRVLKDDGLIIMTFDYPDINLAYMSMISNALGFIPAGHLEREIPADAIHFYFQRKDFFCYRLVLKKSTNKTRGFEK